MARENVEMRNSIKLNVCTDQVTDLLAVYEILVFRLFMMLGTSSCVQSLKPHSSE
jgi:hypothetical protein